MRQTRKVLASPVVPYFTDVAAQRRGAPPPKPPSEAAAEPGLVPLHLGLPV